MKYEDDKGELILPPKAHDENDCPICTPIINTEAYRRGVAKASVHGRKL